MLARRAGNLASAAGAANKLRLAAATALSKERRQPIFACGAKKLH